MHVHHDRWQMRISIGTIDLVSTMNPPLRRRNGRDDDCDVDDGGGDGESLSWWMMLMMQQHPRVQDPPGLPAQRMTCVTGTVVEIGVWFFFLFFFEFVLGGFSAEKMKKLFSLFVQNSSSILHDGRLLSKLSGREKTN